MSNKRSSNERKHHPWNRDFDDDDDIESISQLSCRSISDRSYSSSQSPKAAEPDDDVESQVFLPTSKHRAKEESFYRRKDAGESIKGNETASHNKIFRCALQQETAPLHLCAGDEAEEIPKRDGDEPTATPRWWEPNSGGTTPRWWERRGTAPSDNSGRSGRSSLSFVTPPPPQPLRPSRRMSRPGAFSIPGINARDYCRNTGEEEKEEETLGNSTSSTASTFENEYDDMPLLEASLVCSEKSLITTTKDRDKEAPSNELFVQAVPLKSRCTPWFVCSLVMLLLVIAGISAAAGLEWGRRQYDLDAPSQTDATSPSSTSPSPTIEDTGSDTDASALHPPTQHPTSIIEALTSGTMSPPPRIPTESEEVASAVTTAAPESLASLPPQSESYGSPQGAPLVSTATTDATSRKELILNYLPEKTKSFLGDPASAQSKAYNWLLADPLLEKYPPERLVQRFALAVLFWSSNGEEWESSENWLSYTVPECGWLTDTLGGLLCNEEELYEILSLNSLTLSGSLPEEIWLLSALVSVQLYNHDLQGTLPTRIGKMPRLEGLHLFDLNLTGTIPNEVGLESLKSLHLGGNSLVGSIPPDLLSKSTQLRNLYLNDNDLSGSLPESIGNLRALEELVLLNNSLTSTIPESLSELTNLRLLYLAMNNFEGTIPDLSSLSELRGLILQSNRFQAFFPDLSGLSKLEYLFLGQNNFLGPLPPQVIASLTSLQVLDVRQNGLSDSIPSEIGFLTKLQALDMFDNYLTSSIPPSLGQLTDTQKIMLENNVLDGTIPSTLGLLTNLRRLWLHDNDLSGTVPEEICNLVKRSNLDLSVDCFKVVCDCDCNCGLSTSGPMLSGSRMSSPPTAWDQVVSAFQNMFNW